MTTDISESFAGVSLAGGYLFIKVAITPSVWWNESVHSVFAICTALIIAVVSTLAIHFVKKFLKWFDEKFKI